MTELPKPTLPDLKLIESMHEFPTMFSFKAIGDYHAEFTADVLSRVTAAIGLSRKIEHTVRMSSAGSHISVTILAECLNAEEVHLVYEELLKVNGLRALF